MLSEANAARRLLLRRQRHGKGRALADLGGDGEHSAMAVEDVLDDGQTQPRSALLAARRYAHAVEALGEAGQMLGGDAGPIVRHGGDESGRAPAAGRLARHADLDAPAWLAVLDGVLHQILEHLHD